jgi:TRAP-type uncharacterized transport system substrate-binding protein
MYYVLYVINTVLFITILILINKNNREDFVTWFKPYYNNKITENPLLNTTEIYNENTLAHKYNFNKVVLGTYQESTVVDISLNHFVKYMTKIILQNSNILDIHIKIVNHAYKLLDNLNKNYHDIAYAPSPILYDALVGTKLFKNKSLSNIRFISNINNVSIFFFVSKVGNVKSLYDLPGSTIGVINDKSVSWKCASDILTQLELSKKDYKFKYIELSEAFHQINSGELDCFIYDTVFPSTDLKNYFEINIGTNVRILPLDEIDESIFTSRFFYYEPIYLDLNKLAKNYLPSVIGNFKFNKFKPMLKTYSFHNYLLCHRSLEDNTSYNLIKSIYNNIDEINKLNLFKNKPLIRNNIAWSALPISIHSGVKKFLYEKGYISYGTIDKHGKIVEDPNCLFLISKKECNKKNLEILKVPPIDYTFMNEYIV